MYFKLKMIFKYFCNSILFLLLLAFTASVFSGHAADTDVVVAAAQAYINALNRLVAAEGRKSIHPQHDLAQADKKGI